MIIHVCIICITSLDSEGYLGVAYAHAAVLVAEAVKQLQKIHEKEMNDMKQAFRSEMDEMRQAYDKELRALKSDVEVLVNIKNRPYQNIQL